MEAAEEAAVGMEVAVVGMEVAAGEVVAGGTGLTRLPSLSRTSGA